MKFHFIVSRRCRGLRFGAENWSNRCDALAFTSLPLEAQVIRTLSGQIILRNLLFTLPLYLCIRYPFMPVYTLRSAHHDYKRSISLQNCTFRLQIESTWMKSRSSNIQLHIEYPSNEKKNVSSIFSTNLSNISFIQLSDPRFNFYLKYFSFPALHAKEW